MSLLSESIRARCITFRIPSPRVVLKESEAENLLTLTLPETQEAHSCDAHMPPRSTHSTRPHYNSSRRPNTCNIFQHPRHNPRRSWSVGQANITVAFDFVTLNISHHCSCWFDCVVFLRQEHQTGKYFCNGQCNDYHHNRIGCIHHLDCCCYPVSHGKKWEGFVGLGV
jgi:hypothetical protein